MQSWAYPLRGVPQVWNSCGWNIGLGWKRLVFYGVLWYKPKAFTAVSKIVVS